MARRNISDERKGLFYAGRVIMIIGILLFFSVFVTAACNFGNFDNFDARARSSAIRGILGMALAIIGGIMQAIGARGAAGSGVILDPEKAREDLEPWSRMAGGMIMDALDEADVDLSGARGSKTPPESEVDFDARLRKLHQLYEDGILSKEEYEREKREVLDNN